MRRQLLFLFAAGVVAVLALLAWCLAEARRDPVVRRAEIVLPGWPAGATPVRVVLISDLHLGNLSTDGARLERIASRVNALHPDLILIAGDLVAGDEPGFAATVADELATGLRRFRAPLGVVAVPGNHDHWTGLAAVERAAGAAGVMMLRNAAVRLGPLAIAGVDDAYTGHARLGPARAAAARAGGAQVVLSHSPDVAPLVSSGLVLAGHTHCGQVVPPVVGAITTASDYGERYRCGIAREGRRLTIVTAGTGTSTLPLRMGAAPDLWVLTLRGGD